MRTSKFSINQIAKILRSADTKGGVATAASANGISVATVYQWRARYGRSSERDMQAARDIKQENVRLKHVYFELKRDHLLLQQVLEKMLSPVQRRNAVNWAVEFKHFSQRRACRLLMQNRGTQRRSLRDLVPAIGMLSF